MPEHIVENNGKAVILQGTYKNRPLFSLAIPIHKKDRKGNIKDTWYRALKTFTTLESAQAFLNPVVKEVIKDEKETATA